MAIKLRDPLNLNLRIVSRYKPDVILAEQKSGFIDGYSINVAEVNGVAVRLMQINCGYKMSTTVLK